MEVQNFAANLNWSGAHGAHPLNLKYADVDVALRLLPTRNIQLPLSYTQYDGECGYFAGADIDYHPLPGAAASFATELHNVRGRLLMHCHRPLGYMPAAGARTADGDAVDDASRASQQQQQQQQGKAHSGARSRLWHVRQLIAWLTRDVPRWILGLPAVAAFCRVFPRVALTHILFSRLGRSNVNASLQVILSQARAALVQVDARVQWSRWFQLAANRAVQIVATLSDSGLGRLGATLAARMNDWQCFLHSGAVRDSATLTYARRIPLPSSLRQWLVRRWASVEESTRVFEDDVERRAAPVLEIPRMPAHHIAAGRWRAVAAVVVVLTRLGSRLALYWWRWQSRWWLGFLGGWPPDWRRIVVVLWRAVLQQLMQLFTGLHTCVSIEGMRMRARAGEHPQPQRVGLRVPVELHWACDWMRMWLCVDLWNESKRMNLVQHHSVTVGAMLLDSIVLFEHTFSLMPLWRLLGIAAFDYLPVPQQRRSLIYSQLSTTANPWTMASQYAASIDFEATTNMAFRNMPNSFR